MIPKVIHYCWFGKKEKSQNVLECIETWQQVLPDYFIKEWNEDNFNYSEIGYAYEAYRLRKFAFVSDVARLYALVTEGGVYLDTDVKVIRSFDPYLKHHSFIGMENPYRVSTAVIGAEPNVNWISAFYESYKKTHFIRISGGMKNIPNTAILSRFLDVRYPCDEQDLTRYDMDYFCAKIFSTKEYKVTPNTVAIHDFNGSWKSDEISMIDRIKNILIRSKVHLRYMSNIRMQ